MLPAMDEEATVAVAMVLASDIRSPTGSAKALSPTTSKSPLQVAGVLFEMEEEATVAIAMALASCISSPAGSAPALTPTTLKSPLEVAGVLLEMEEMVLVEILRLCGRSLLRLGSQCHSSLASRPPFGVLHFFI